MRLRRVIFGLVVTGLLLLPAALRAEEHAVNTIVSSTTLSGYIDTSAIWGGPQAIPADQLPGVAPIPEPSTTVLLVAGVFGCWLTRGFRSRRQEVQR